eukprot:TRINITY_DN864_c0_g1_i4.p1 TRINITY_DN864_c0_g1~~TRINITY_DN864_c0_g1_i4.p1  ORF type:complete len:377 (+),score=84.50 TRINITY_DN864_c0_g1_i4:66-1196(+)
MCIRDRVSTQSTWGLNNKSASREMKRISVGLCAIALLLGVSLAQDGVVLVSPPLDNSQLINPGIGYQASSLSNASYMEETVAYSRLEYSWANIHKTAETYDMNRIREDIKGILAQNKKVGIRISTLLSKDEGGLQIPDWLLSSVRTIQKDNVTYPDYRDCNIQEYFGRVIDTLRLTFDGNAGIAFVDISGYGFEDSFRAIPGVTDCGGDCRSLSGDSMDFQARKRIMDVFLGGSGTVNCYKGNETGSFFYTYQGFKFTQLIMPYGGNAQNNLYVMSKRADIGLRHDNAGDSRYAGEFTDSTAFPAFVNRVWKVAPIILRASGDEDLSLIAGQARNNHACLLAQGKGWPWLSLVPPEDLLSKQCHNGDLLQHLHGMG